MKIVRKDLVSGKRQLCGSRILRSMYARQEVAFESCTQCLECVLFVQTDSILYRVSAVPTSGRDKRTRSVWISC